MHRCKPIMISHYNLINQCTTSNGVAERAIRTVSDLAHSMILHASSHWEGGIDRTLWPNGSSLHCALLQLYTK